MVHVAGDSGFIAWANGVDTSIAGKAPISFTWVTATAYKTGQLVVNSGQPYTAVDDHTAGATFAGDSAHWTLVVPGMEIANSVLSSNYVFTSSYADVGAAWSVVVPANMGVVELNITPLLLTCVTGTNAAGTMFSVEIEIVDEAAAVVGYFLWKFGSSLATTQSFTVTQSYTRRVANNGSQKTYHIKARNTLVGTNSCTSTLFSSASGFFDPVLSARRV